MVPAAAPSRQPMLFVFLNRESGDRVQTHRTEIRVQIHPELPAFNDQVFAVPGIQPGNIID